MMKKSTRGAIYSLLVFPGAGLWVLGEKKRALIFIIPTIIAVVLLMTRIFTITQNIANQLPITNLSIESFIDTFKVLYAETRTQIYQDSSVIHFLLVLLVAMIISSVFSYFVGKKQEQEEI
jgi:hypothetical protein